MKLVINIPCYNEEKTLPLVLEELPKELPGISSIDVQIVDDGSTDATVKVAESYGCRVVRHRMNQGLGRAFATGTAAALAAGADIMVNTDADNQYPSRFIADLLVPVVAGEADVVIGNRKPWKVRHFSLLKRFFQYIGNSITRKIAGVEVPDTVSGFRAYSREALLQMNITTKFSYVLDTIVQAAKKGLVIVSVPIEINLPTRKSRLFRNMFDHMKKSAANILRVYTIYEPFKTFLLLSAIFFVPALILLLRFCYFFWMGDGSGHIQSLLISVLGFVFGGLLFSLGVLGDLVGMNRLLLEKQLYYEKKRRYAR